MDRSKRFTVYPRGAAGFSLLEVMAVSVISGILLLAIANSLVSMQNESKSLFEKMATLDMDRSIQAAMMANDICAKTISLSPPGKYVVPLGDFPPTTPIPLDELYEGAAPLSFVRIDQPLTFDPNGIKVQAIQMINLGGTDPNVSGTLEVQFKDALRAINSVKIPISVKTTIVGTTLRIDGCTPSTSASCLSLGGEMIAGQCTNYIGQSAASMFRRIAKAAVEMERGGPSDAIVMVQNAYADPDSSWSGTASDGKLDGARCNATAGWRLVGCFGSWAGSADVDVIAFSEIINGARVVTGCLSNDGANAEFVVQCVKNFK